MDIQAGQSLPGELQAAVPGVAGHRASAGRLEQPAATMPLLPAPGRAGPPLPPEQRCHVRPPRASHRVGGWQGVPSSSGGGCDLPLTISDPANASLRMLRTASPSPAGAGVRCLYQDGSLLEGWQERAWSLPIHPTAGKQATGLPHPKTPPAPRALQVQRGPRHPPSARPPSSADRELEAFDWCCRHVGKPLFCDRFAEKRPRVGCEGYVPPTPGESPGLCLLCARVLRGWHGRTQTHA